MTTLAHATSEAPALRWGERRVLLASVSAAAAVLDTLAFVYLGKVFVSFMTGNLLFLGLAAGQGTAGLLVRAAVALAAFLVGAALGARLTGSHLLPDETRGMMRRTLLIEAAILAAFGLLWAVQGPPTVALIAIAAVAMGMQAAVALALHLPNIATVAMTATLAQLAALVGWREREGPRIVGSTPSAAIMVLLCLSYLCAAIVVATLPETPLLAFAPMVLVLVAAAQ